MTFKTYEIAENSCVEVVQARVDENGEASDSLKERIDKGFRKNTNIVGIHVKDFGATGDGISDDGPALYKAHVYANQNSLTVNYDATKKYYVKAVSDIPIMTDVNFNGCTIIVDDTYNPTSSVYYIKESLPIVTFDSTKLSAIDNKIKPNVKNIPELAGYGDAFVIAANSEIKQYKRFGPNKNAGVDLTEWFMINALGDILSPISFDAGKITSLKVQPISNNFITIKNAKFISRGTLDGDSYFHRGIKCERSRVNIQNFTHTLENNSTTLRPNTGFLQLNNCGYVNLNDISLTPRIFHNSIGTYELGTLYVCNLTIDNMDAYSTSGTVWGIFGGNRMKDLVVKNSRLNRIDSHLGSHNVTVENTLLGNYGIRLVGFGLLKIRNVVINSNAVVELREDYGSLWDGDIDIDGVKHRPPSNTHDIIKIKMEARYDFGYPIRVGRNFIKVRNYDVDTSNITSPMNLINPTITRDVKVPSDLNTLVMADNITFEDITTTSTKGFNLFGASYHEIRVDKSFNYQLVNFVSDSEIYQIIEQNSTINCRNVKWHDYGSSQGFDKSNLFPVGAFGSKYTDNFEVDTKRLLPMINISNCGALNASCFSFPAILNIVNSTVTAMYNKNMGGSKSRTILDACTIKPFIDNDTVIAVRGNRVELHFKQCSILAPVLSDGSPILDSKFKTVYEVLPFGGSSQSMYQNCNLFNCTIDPRIEINNLRNDYTDFSYPVGSCSYAEMRPRKKGTTAQRPSGTAVKTGDTYYDTTLNKVIVYTGTGTGWIDSMGTDV